MKKLIFILITSIFMISIPVQADSTYTVINSFFQISGGIDTWNMINLPDYHGVYSENSSTPLTGNLIYYSSNVYSEASFEKVETGGVVHLSGYGSPTYPYGDTAGHTFASTEVLFSPNFIGAGTPITFNVFRVLYGGDAYASITDLTAGETIFSKDDFADYNYPQNITIFSYSEWNPDHTYRLYMTASNYFNMSDDGWAQASNDISFAFVPEPTTMLLLGLGLIGLVGVKRKFSN